MNDSGTLEERLDQIGLDVGQRPSRVSDVMAELGRLTQHPQPRRRTVPGLRTIAAFATATCLIVPIIIWLARPVTLYARALDALGDAQTVHITGWTTQIIRKWPLEDPLPNSDLEQHPVDAWYWRDVDGNPRSHERFGPVIQVRDGGTLQEYQEDSDLLFISEGSPKDHLDRFSAIAEYLRALDGDGIEKQELGTRDEGGQTLSGLRVTRHNRTDEFWFDVETDLPTSFVRSLDEDGTTVGFELQFSYDEPVPMAVAEYTLPETDNIRHGGRNESVQLAWRRHVQDIGLHLQDQPLPGPVAILPRGDRRTFSGQWQLMTPDGNYHVVPLDLDQYFGLTVKNFINLQVATAYGDRAYETWRIPEELLEEEFPLSDLVYREGTPWQEWVQYALNQNGLEYVDRIEQRTFWIARHDGRELKPWRDIEPPVPYIVEGGEVKRGVVRPGIGHQNSPETMHGLFEDFNRIQNNRFAADHPIIVDETGLPRPPKYDPELYANFADFREQVLDEYYVAADSPYFARSESRQMARDWFEEMFGVTFVEETRPITVHSIRRKQ